ncbi:MAG TPA: helix-turn-helix domain-containing protein [Chitinophaga sp.]|nr:helix-turn-helix domain-containing protein [Chitinophaga sp.]
MSAKKTQGKYFKHEDFMLMKEIDFKPSFEGFAVNTNVKVVESDQLKENFRTDFLCIMLVIEGNIQYRMNMKDYHLTTNDLVFITAHTLKQFISAEASSRIAVLTFTTEFIAKQRFPDNFMEVMDYFSTKHSPLWSLNQKDAQRMAQLFTELENRTGAAISHPFGKELVYHSFYIVMYELAALAQQYMKQDMQQSPRKESLVISFTNLVQLQFTHQRNVSQYAEQLYVTPKYLTETVKEITGKSAGELIDHFVIVEAKLLLDNPKLSIAQVAESLNFSDQSFFGKFFKRHTGFSPKDYRINNKIIP